MKKIDVITKYFYPQDGGIERSILETYSRLANAGFTVTVHTSTNTYVRNAVLPPKSKMKRLKVKRYSKRSFDLWPKINYQNTDFICLHNFNILPHTFVLLYCLILKVSFKKHFKLIITPHGGMTPNYTNFGKLEALAKKWINLLLIRLLVNNTADAVRMVSLWEKREVLKLGLRPDLIREIPDGIENEAFSKKTKEKRSISGLTLPLKYLIQIGKIYPTKKYETAIGSLRYLKDKSIGLVIVGRIKDQNYMNSLIDLAKKEGTEKRLKFLSFVTVQQKYQLLAHSQAFILSSDWESFGRIAIEAMSQGVPLIISDKTAPSVLIPDKVAGFKFNNNDPRGLAKLIDKAVKIKDSGAETKLIKNKNTEYAKKYSWDNVSNEFKKLIIGLSDKSL